MTAKTITICNRLNRVHSQTGLDVWYKHILHDIPYSIQCVATVNGTQTAIGEVFEILIPFDDDYLSYKEWKDDTHKDTHYSMNQGDLIFIDVDIPDTITPNNIVNLKNLHKPNVIEVRSIMEVQKRQGVNYRLKVSGI